MAATGNLLLIPCPISEGMIQTIPGYIWEKIKDLRHFYVENERTARRYLKLLHPSIRIDDLSFYPVNAQHPPDLLKARAILSAGNDLGLMSEAGCPAVADPGNLVVSLAHDLEASVIPLTGPNSIILALMASGMNGQHFTFHGYLPIKSPERMTKIRELEQQSAKSRVTQVFIETPYRNLQLIADLIQVCAGRTRLCIAADLTGPHQFIRTRTIESWKKQLPQLHKIPAIFLLEA
jgi:16S rRNA (cytidine1402-2'-O)-methyltransferase